MTIRSRKKLCCLLTVFFFVPGVLTAQQSDWSYWGSSHFFQRYSSAAQINAGNVAELEIVWRRPAVDQSITDAFPGLRVSGNLRATPIYINGVLYSSNGIGLVEAFDPATGATLWVQQPDENSMAEVQGQSSRGVEYWSDGREEALFVIRKGSLLALDPKSGAIISSFANDGRINLVPETANNFSYVSGGPIVVNDVIVIAGTIDGAGDSGTRWRGVASEDVRGYDVRTGEHLWTFHAVPQEGEFGYDTWANDSARESGDLGAWCCLSADPQLGIVYVPFTAPTAAYYGGHRGGDNLFSNSLVAIDIETGERVWHFQMVHHDVWEYDNVGPPVLGNIVVDGRPIRAVMQANKTGFIYVFDRATGEPVWPIVERPVPVSDVPGEMLSATQPFPTKPAPIATQGITPDDIIDFPEIGQIARAEVANFVIGPIFTPPTLISNEVGGTQGTLTLPGSWGSANWNTGAFDPDSGYYFGFANDIPRVYRLEPAEQEDTEMEYWSPNREAPYIDGIPLTKPPWGRITAIDMNRGEHVWQVANGDSLGDHPSLENLDLQSLGIASRPVALVTKTLLFIGEGSNLHGGTMPNMWGTNFRAYDKSNGEVVWQMELPSGTTGGPMSYLHDGKQFIVVAVGSYGDPAEFIALALP
ncbi:MAG: PQQ-binding-like beta-propeller repeat protein [Gammaproteobacteria bacterium]|nr:PQQ-binding-like beta-propeller repeat protein [Gammaproteobacteria bacterium]MDD9957971.1 PQQ-binding-like beta-propeller repeat protein [Gammaproteobacteria bacterium]